jgi:tRNA 2-thiouridine synthesizing protein A
MITINLDTTRDLYPVTFVRTNQYLEILKDGDVLEVLLREGEPLENVSKTALDQGFKVLETIHVKDNFHKVIIQK